MYVDTRAVALNIFDTDRRPVITGTLPVQEHTRNHINEEFGTVTGNYGPLQCFIATVVAENIHMAFRDILKEKLPSAPILGPPDKTASGAF